MQPLAIVRSLVPAQGLRKCFASFTLERRFATVKRAVGFGVFGSAGPER